MNEEDVMLKVNNDIEMEIIWFLYMEGSEFDKKDLHEKLLKLPILTFHHRM